MKRLKEIDPSVYVTNEVFPRVDRGDIAFLCGGAGAASKGRIRSCMHKTNDARLHEMFIAFSGANYVRPSHHVGKDESLHMLVGAADSFFFDSSGTVTDVISLGSYCSEDRFYCRIPAFVKHALFIRSETAAIHEATPGPFNREDTIFPSWSPEESNQIGVARFLEGLRRVPRAARPMLKIKRTTQEIFVADEPVVSIGRKEIEFLKQKIHETECKFVQLCVHREIENTLHETFGVYTEMTYSKPNKLLHRDKSLHVLEGEADLIFFDEQGRIIEIVALGAYDSGRCFYLRVPASVYHTVIMRSGHLVIHEVTSSTLGHEFAGASWAPAGTDKVGVANFMRTLREAVSRHLATVK